MNSDPESIAAASVERMYLNRDELARVERQYALEMHYMRYHFARQFVSGVVLDIACGCGYGTYMLTQKTPDVSRVIGVDASSSAIDHARRHFKVDKNNFVCSSVADFRHNAVIDWVVSIETIEHLAAPVHLMELCCKHRVGRALLTYPTRRTTHYNPYHLHDMQLSDIERLFAPEYRVIDQYQYHREFQYVLLGNTSVGQL